MKNFLNRNNKKKDLVAIVGVDITPKPNGDMNGRQRSFRRGSSGRERTTSSSSITVDSRETFVERLRSQKATRDKTTNHERVRELRDQNQYLLEKVQFLKLQKLRNESEIIRRDDNNKELKKIHDSYVSQLQSIEELIGEWQEFHTSVTDASESWSSMSQSLGDSDAQVSGHEIV